MAGHIKSIYGIVVSWLIAPSDTMFLSCKSREFHILPGSAPSSEDIEK